MAEIDRVRSLGLDELRTLWRLTFRSSPPPAITKDLMARFFCWQGHVTGDRNHFTGKASAARRRMRSSSTAASTSSVQTRNVFNV